MRQEDGLVIDGETESMLLARYMTCVPGVKIADCGSIAPKTRFSLVLLSKRHMYRTRLATYPAAIPFACLLRRIDFSLTPCAPPSKSGSDPTPALIPLSAASALA